MSSHPLYRMLPLVLMTLLMVGHASTGVAEEGDATVEQLKQDTRELGRTLKDFSADQKDQAIESINSTLEALDKRINQLEEELAANWDDMSELARERSRESIDSLRDQRVTVAQWYERLKDSSASAWDRMKEGFSNAYGELSESWEETEEVNERNQQRDRNSI